MTDAAPDSADRVPGTVNLDWQLFPVQLRLLELLQGPKGDWYSGVNRALYGGQAGGGKSGGLCRIAVLYALAFPGSRCILFRRTEDEARETFIPRMAEFLPPDMAKYTDGDKRWTFARDLAGMADKPSVIRIGYLAKDEHLTQYFSEDFDFVGFDEGVQFQPHHIDFIVDTRLRSAQGYPTKVLICTNPGGPAHEKLYGEYIEDREPFEVYEDVRTVRRGGVVYTDTQRRVFVPAKVEDNAAIIDGDQGYLVRLEHIKDDVLKKRLAEGDWTINSGSAFRDWNKQRHVVEPFPIPRHWRRWAGIDFGFRDPTVVLWFAQNPENRRIYLYREFAQTEVGDQELKAAIASAAAGERVDMYYVDSSGGSRGQMNTQKSLIDVLSEPPNALPMERAKKARLEGWSTLRSLLKDLPDGLPALQVFEHCKGFVKAIAKMQYDEKRDGDLIEHPLDHWVDSARYAMASRVYQTPHTEAEVTQPGDFGRRVKKQKTSNEWRRMAGVY